MKYNTDQMKQDAVGCQAILDSIEARWAKSDQEVFVATVIVNPFFRMSAFRPLQCFNKAEIRVLFTRLYRRFFAVEPPHTFIEDTYNFLDGKELFQAIRSEIDYETEAATRKVSLRYNKLLYYLNTIYRKSNLTHLVCSTNLFLRDVLKTLRPSSFSPVAFFPFLQILHHVNDFSAFSATFSQKLVTGLETQSLQTLPKSRCTSVTNILHRARNLALSVALVLAWLPTTLLVMTPLIHTPAEVI